MRLYNTLTRKKEEFIVHDNTVRMYVCGPTVYNYIHLGNARCFVVFDMLRRYLEYKGYKVIYVQNFTDVDDKLIRRAAEEGTTVAEVAEKYIREYKIDAEGLGIREATVHPRATENIDKIIEFIKKLIEKGHAYVSGGDVYFDQKSDPEYGKLSHHNLDDLEAGARIDVNEVKKNPYDFALWKAKKEGEVSWPSPWGEGRPGWHIECSAMVNRYLGTNIDIHCGGPDLIFPHHENEIAQTECATGEPMARFWLHIGFLNVDNMKMSKSLGNFFMTREAAQKYGYLTIRYFLLSAHYRSPINFSAEILEQSAAALERLLNCSDNMQFRLASASDRELNEKEKASVAFLEQKKLQFIEAMDDDFNTADAISVIFELVREANTLVSSGAMTRRAAEKVLALFDELTGVLGLLYAEKDEDTKLAEEVEALIAARQAARKEKNWAEADRIRDKLKEMGIILEDTPQGVRWKRA